MHDAMTAIDEKEEEVEEAGHIQGGDNGEVVACARNWVDTYNVRNALPALLVVEDLVVAAVVEAGNTLQQQDVVHNDDAVDASDADTAVVDDQKLPGGTGHHRPMMEEEVVAAHELDLPWNASFGLAEAQRQSVSVNSNEEDDE